ncbi:hypothetical protein SpCBS45565_g07739 [Spizellomyces sp. 'palustris']|nr:hypothetical protein SpCBS45565_g07739 [Spizellomyces sp. 'palustris']
MSLLFSPIQVGDMHLKHRCVMGPMTRSRSPGEVANDLNAEYYAQRATDGGLIISEGTSCSVTAKGYEHVPACLTEEQAKGWKKTTDAVHAKGGYIYAQLWHVGRASTASLQPDNKPPVSASDLPTKGKDKPRALTVEEIKFIVSEYKLSTRRAREANFDGIEIHAAHGYLIDQFLQTSSNKRTDQYGGSIENRSRFLFEVLEACLSELPASKVAIRLSPYMNGQDVSDENPNALFTYVISRLAKYKLSYLQLTEPVWGSWRPGPPHSQSKLNEFAGLLQSPTKLILTGGYTLETAEQALQEGRGDLIGFARPFITNPDFVERLRNAYELTPYMDFKKYYGGGAEQYTDWDDYAALEAKRKTSKSGQEQAGAGASHL